VIWRRRCIGLLGFCLISIGSASGQDEPARLLYDVASVRPSEPGAPEGEVDPLPGGIGYNAERISVKDMISVMYRIPLRQIVGGPEWLTSEKFDVEARADHPYSIDDLHIMFQNLLADRFNLKLHKEIRTGPVYVLTVAKSGLKMTPVDAGTDRHNPITTIGDNEAIGDRVPLNYLCFWLGQNLQNDERPVVDKTGLTGTYDFTLRFRPQLPPDVSAEGLSPEIQNLPSIFDAMKAQLGLELVPQKGPVEFLVIDHVEKPSGN
jgi:uncharacterized protein (TIGR03435 family)